MAATGTIQIAFVGDASNAIAELSDAAMKVLQIDAVAKLGGAWHHIKVALDRDGIQGLVEDRAALEEIATAFIQAREAVDVLWHLAPETES